MNSPLQIKGWQFSFLWNNNLVLVYSPPEPTHRGAGSTLATHPLSSLDREREKLLLSSSTFFKTTNQTETVTLNHNLPLSFISKSEGCCQSNCLEEYKWWQPSLLKGRLMKYDCFLQMFVKQFTWIYFLNPRRWQSCLDRFLMSQFAPKLRLILRRGLPPNHCRPIFHNYTASWGHRN